MAKVVQFGLPGKERLLFWCPGCDTVMQVCPKRWSWNGDVDKPTLWPSIKQTCGPFPEGSSRAGQTEVCHCFVRDGNIEFCNDCTHEKRGTMPLPELETVIDLHLNDGAHLSWTRK
jgi:hypothetical protein